MKKLKDGSVILTPEEHADYKKVLAAMAALRPKTNSTQEVGA